MRKRLQGRYPWSCVLIPTDFRCIFEDVLDQLLAGSTDCHSVLTDLWKQQHPETVRNDRVEERLDKAEYQQLNAARRRLATRNGHCFTAVRPPYAPRNLVLLSALELETAPSPMFLSQFFGGGAPHVLRSPSTREGSVLY